MVRPGRLLRRLEAFRNFQKQKTDWFGNPFENMGGVIAYFKHFPNAVSLNISFLRHFTKYYGIPVKVGDKVSMDNRTWKNWLFKVLFFVCILRSILVELTLLVSLSVESLYNPVLLPPHLVLAAALPGGVCSAYFMLISNPSELILVWNSVLKHGNVVKKFSFRHLFLYILPVSLYLLGFCVTGLFAWNSHWLPQFRYLVHLAKAEGYLEQGFVHDVLAVSAIALDFSSEMTAVIGAIIAFCLQQLFFEVWLSSAADLMNGAEFNSNADNWMRLSELLIALRIFNVGNASSISVMKALLCNMSIVNLSILLLYDTGNLFLFLMLLYSGFAAPAIYPGIYSRAPDVATSLEQVKLVMLRSIRKGNDAEVFKRQIQTVSTQGVLVGRLGTFEQESMLIFFDFVVNQVASVVLTYRST